MSEAIKLLTDEVVESLLVIQSLEENVMGDLKPLPNCPHTPSFYCYHEAYRSRQERKNLDELAFLTGLSRFNFELSMVELLEMGVDLSRFVNHFDFYFGLTWIHDYRDKFKLPEKAKKLEKEFMLELIERKDDPDIYPALGVARKTGTMDQLIGLLNWIRPLLMVSNLERIDLRDLRRPCRIFLDEGGLSFGTRLDREMLFIPLEIQPEKVLEMKSILGSNFPNLVSYLFEIERDFYMASFFERLWKVAFEKIMSRFSEKTSEGEENAADP